MSLYDDLDAAQTKLKYWKAKELELRNEVLEESSGQKDEGVVNRTVGDTKIKCTYKMNRKIDVAILDGIYDKLSDEELEAIKYKPEIVMKEYRKLEEAGDSILLDAVTITPGQGSVEIKHL